MADADDAARGCPGGDTAGRRGRGSSDLRFHSTCATLYILFRRPSSHPWKARRRLSCSRKGCARYSTQSPRLCAHWKGSLPGNGARPRRAQRVRSETAARMRRRGALRMFLDGVHCFREGVGGRRDARLRSRFGLDEERAGCAMCYALSKGLPGMGAADVRKVSTYCLCLASKVTNAASRHKLNRWFHEWRAGHSYEVPMFTWAGPTDSHLPRGMNPGLPVFTTALNLCLV